MAHSYCSPLRKGNCTLLDGVKIQTVSFNTLLLSSLRIRWKFSRAFLSLVERSQLNIQISYSMQVIWGEHFSVVPASSSSTGYSQLNSEQECGSICLWRGCKQRLWAPLRPHQWQSLLFIRERRRYCECAHFIYLASPLHKKMLSPEIQGILSKPGSELAAHTGSRPPSGIECH